MIQRDTVNYLVRKKVTFMKKNNDNSSKIAPSKYNKVEAKRRKVQDSTTVISL